MRLPVGLLILGLTVSAAFAAANPLTVKEISLMLRSGYSSATVLRELSARGFADIFDGDAEKQLAHAGANGEIIDALKNGKYRVASAPVLPPQPGAATFSQAAPNNDVSQFPRIPSVPSSGQTQQVAQPQPHPPTAPPEVHDSIYSRLKGDLVWLHQGSIVPFDDEPLESKKYFFFFFTANWNPAGRKFAAQLVDYYKQAESQHPEMEVIFFSTDRSQFGMDTLITQTAMPWPAVAFDRLSGKAGDLQRALVKEVPALVFADASGKILSYSHGGENPVTVEQVLREADEILNSGSPTAAR